MPSTFLSQEGGDPDDKEKGSGRKVPSGFEKILKRTRRGISHQNKEEKDTKEKEPEEKKATAAPEEEEQKEQSEDQQ